MDAILIIHANWGLEELKRPLGKGIAVFRHMRDVLQVRKKQKNLEGLEE